MAMTDTTWLGTDWMRTHQKGDVGRLFVQNALSPNASEPNTVAFNVIDTPSQNGDMSPNPNNNATPNPPNSNLPSPKRSNKILKWLLWLIFILALLFVFLYLSLGSQTGSRLILGKIAAETGIELKYGQGNLRDGLWVNDIKIAQGEDVEVEVDRAFVQIGWRAIFARQVHLASANIDNIIIKNHKAPTNEPFEYVSIHAPVSLRIDHATVRHIIYEQATKEPVSIENVSVASATWSGNQVSVDDVNVTITDTVSIAHASGEITLDKEYPLTAVATVIVNDFDELYIDPLLVQAHGTLKRTVGTVSSKYNQSEISGEFVVQGMDEGVPFWATLSAKEFVLPYAKDQAITFKDAEVIASGVTSDIDLRIHTHLNGKDVPQGIYHGQASIHKDGMSIRHLTAHTDGGILMATGDMSWKNDFELRSVIQGQGTQIAPLIPKEYQEYAIYAPEMLRGSLGFDFGANDGKGNAWYEFDLKQDDGETVFARIYQDEHGREYAKGATIVQANWQNLVRTKLPNIGDLNSPSGKTDIIYRDGITHITANANILALSSAPKGLYDVETQIDGQVIDVDRLLYQGEVGDLTATGKIELAHHDKPLSYQFKLNTNKLLPNAYLNDGTPIAYLTGASAVIGVMSEDGRTQHHKITLSNMDMTAGLDDKGVQQVGLMGGGQVTLIVNDGDVTALTADYDGRLKSVGIHDALQDNAVSLGATGNLKTLNINKLILQGEAGNVSLAGQVGIQDMSWDVSARLDELNAGKFHPKASTLVTGDFHSKGRHADGKFRATRANFEGQFKDTDKVSTGDVLADMLIEGQTITLNALNYAGQAGKLSATGELDMATGYVGQLDVGLEEFDIGYFIQDYSSELTGQLGASINWQNNQQSIHIENMNIEGLVNDEDFLAKGVMSAVLDLPSNFDDYFRNLRQDTKRRFDKDLLQGSLANRISNVQNAIYEQNLVSRQLVQALDAHDVMFVMGDNHLRLDGNQSKLVLDIHANTLSQVLPTVRGAVSGGLIIIQDKNALPTFYIDAKAQGLSVGSFAIREGSAIGKVVNLGHADSQMLVQASSILMAGKSLDGFRLDFSGTQSEHNLAMMIDNDDMQLKARLSGGLDSAKYLGVLSEGRLQTQAGILNQRQPTQIAYDIAGGRADVAAHCWQTITTDSSALGSLCLQKTLSISPTMGDVSAVIQNLDTSVFSPILPADLTWHSRLHGKIDAKWGNHTPDINAVIYSDNGEIGLRAKDTDDVVLPYNRVSVIAQTVPTGLKLRTDINAGRGGNGYVDVIVNPYAKDNASKTIAGALVLNNLKLEILRPFFPAIQSMAGDVNLAGGVGGTLAKPLFYGNISLEKGRFALVDVPMTLSNIRLDGNVHGLNANLDGTFNSGNGTGMLTGELDWSHDLQAKLTIIGDKLDISSPPLLSAQVTPHVEVLVRPMDKYVDIKGVVSVPTATIRPPETSASIVTESGDVTVIDRRMSGNVANILAVVEPWSINADIGLDLGDKVAFRGFGATLPLAGALRLTQSGQGKMNAHGVVQVSRRTKIDAIGQNLDLNYAQIRFNGNMMNPRLSIEAVREINSNTVGVRVKGLLEDPLISVFNDAGLSEQEAMNALVTGSIGETGATQISEQGFKDQVTNNLAAAGLSLGLRGTRGLTNDIGQALGLESLVLDASGSGSDAHVNVTGYITPDLYIRYGVGVFNAESTLSMRYQLTRRIYIEATSATEKFVDMVYRWRF